MTRSVHPANTSASQRETIFIRGYTPFKYKLVSMVEGLRQLSSEDKEIKIYTNRRNSAKAKPGEVTPSGSDENWVAKKMIPRRLDRLCLDPEVRNKILDVYQDFVSSKDWYHDTGTTYKLCYLLEGPPGTGKSSLVRAFATFTKRNLYRIDLPSIFDHEFIPMLDSVPPGSIVLLDDITVSGAQVNRTQTSGASDFGHGVTLYTLQQALDGVAGLDDVIIFINTNHVEELEDTLTRKFRIDHIVHVGEQKYPQVAVFLKEQSGITLDEGFSSLSIKGCDLHAIMRDTRTDPESMKAELVKYLN